MRYTKMHYFLIITFFLCTVLVSQIKPVKAAWSPGKYITKYIEYKREQEKQLRKMKEK